MRVAEAVLTHLRLDIRMDSEPLIRAMALCYLADWKAALELERQITTAKWVKVSWGPYAPEIVEAMVSLHNNRLHSSHVGAHYSIYSVLESREIEILDNIRDKYLARGIGEILNLVKSTFPILYNSSEGGLDLVALANTYKADFAGDISRHKGREKAVVSID